MALYNNNYQRQISTPVQAPVSTPVVATTLAVNDTNSFNEALDKIACYLIDGSLWHKRVANQCRKIAIRGVGRWHDAEGHGDYILAKRLEKVLGDKLGYYPNIDISKLESAVKITLTGMPDFKEHFNEWYKREEELCEILNNTVSMARSIDIQLYEKLLCILDEVQNEKMRVKLVQNRLEMAGWNGHDIGVVSMVLHEYFECRYKQGEQINFNIG